MRIPRFATLSISVLLGAATLQARPVPMEPAERTLFVFVHGINPRSAGAVVGDMGGESNFCVENGDLKGKASLVWLKNLDGDKSSRSLFCMLNEKLFGKQYSLRAFTNPGASPVWLSHELGDRLWRNNEEGLQSHVIEAMRRYLASRLDRVANLSRGDKKLSAFEAKLKDLYPNGAIGDLKPIFEIMPDSVPSRVVVFAHSMGGLTTREYLASDFFNGDLDKVVTYDSPHGGSWVAYYGTDGLYNPLQSVIEDGWKVGIGYALLSFDEPWADVPGIVYTTSGIASMQTRLATNFGGFMANRFIGDENGNRYLTPDNVALMALNRRSAMPCEAKGCRVPSFVLHGVDGVLAPDDPAKFTGTGLPGWFLPLEGIDAAQAISMTLGRPWPNSIPKDEKLANSIVAASFAFGGWNYTQHGSLVVPLHSSRADGIPFLERPEVRRAWHLTDWHKEAIRELGFKEAVFASWANSATGLSGAIIGLEALTIAKTCAPWLKQEFDVAKIAISTIVGATVGFGMAAEFGLYSMAQGASHNAAIWLNATRKLSETVTRGDGTKKILRFTEAEADLYEAPFVQLVAERAVDSTSDSIYILGIGTGSGDTIRRDLRVATSQFQDIRYESSGWESRWAIREEHHVPVQDSSTRVRKVMRRTLPAEILTKTQISSLDFQIDDLRPDLMEQMEVVLNYGMFRITWDREDTILGIDKGTYTLRCFQGGSQAYAKTGVPNPIDVYGRWHVPLKELIPSQFQVLIDGQNRIGVSLVNHVGQFSAQSQFITFQATPPVVTMDWPRPWSVASDVARNARFEANLLYYKGLRFDTAGAWWAAGSMDAATDSVIKRRIPGLLASDSVQTLELPLSEAIASGADGKWELQLQIQDVQDVSKQKGTAAARRFPFWIDRTPPVFRVDRETRQRGEPWRFRIGWSDAPEGLSDAVELVRLRIRDLSGNAVAELPPFEFVTGGTRLVSWNGQGQGGEVADGRYVLEVVGKDGALPGPEVEKTVLELRKEIVEHLDSGAAIWSPRRDSIWNALRALPHMNWASATDTFIIDRIAPRMAAGALAKRLLGANDRLDLSLDLADAGAALRGDSVSLRFVFRDSVSKRGFASGLIVGSIAGDLAHPTRVHFTEDSSSRSLLPDGNWSITVLATDAEGNVDSMTVPRTVRVDRAPPRFTFLSPSPGYVSTASGSVEGKVGLEIRGAENVTAKWRLPTGTTYPAQLSKINDSMWTVTYPAAMKSSAGTWILEVAATDEAGNTTRSSTFVLVDRIPPRLVVPPQIQGPVVLKGLAMDPQVDEHPFRSYELSWREVGDTTWRHDGLRIPLGRGIDSVPWRSRTEQGVKGVLGFWDPPAVAGSVELRVSVDDGTGTIHEAISESYVSSREPSTFSVKLDAWPDTLIAGAGARVGFDIASSAGLRSYDAQAILVDARNAVLWSSHRSGLRTSALEGRPSQFANGSLHVWHQDSIWHLRSAGACRGFRAILQTWSSDSLRIPCPQGWVCRQDSMPEASLALEGDSLKVNRVVVWSIPSGSVDSVAWMLPGMGRLSFLPDSVGSSCAVPPEEACGSPIATRFLPAPGEIRLGTQARSECGSRSSVALSVGQGSLSEAWDGFRQNGNWPDGDSATLEADVWDSATGRLEHARVRLPLRTGVLRLGAKALGGVLLASDAPAPQKRAALDFTVEGRGAVVATRIERDGRLVKTLEGSGSWREGRVATRPYRLTWDGSDNQGNLVEQGSYRFVVEADGVAASAEVGVGGSAWRSDSSLRFSFAPGEATWSTGLNAWTLQPPPVVHVETGVEANRSGGTFQYDVTYSGRQNLIAYRTQRPSLMIRRKRAHVKFGLLWKISTMQKGDDATECLWADCEDRDRASLVTNYYDGGVVEIGRGETITREITEHVQPTLGRIMPQMMSRGHRVEYMAVPLEFKQWLPKQIGENEWQKGLARAFAHGSIDFNDLVASPTYGDSDRRDSTRNLQGEQAFVSKPNPPRKCGHFATGGDSALDHTSWIDGKCLDSDQDAVNPNRNLIWFGIRPMHQRKLSIIEQSVEWIVASATGRNEIDNGWKSSYVWNNCLVGVSCPGSQLRDFSFAFDMRVPDEFFDAEEGIDNLANRLLRFDAANSFLYGPDGFLVKDGYDNDGNGRIDDPGEAIGPMTPFEQRSYNWRPVWEEPGKTLHPSMGTQRKWLPASVLPVVSSLEGAGAGWRRIGEIASCDPGSNESCQEWRRETPDSNATLAVGNILQDKLNIFEGDHSLDVDSLILWFANQPEQGTSRFVAKVRQGDAAWSLDSRSHRNPTSGMRLGLSRGAFSSGLVTWTLPGIMLLPPVIVSASFGDTFVSHPVQFTVSMQSDVVDASASPGDLVRVPWPLDSLTWVAEKARIESSCSSLDAADPAACRRVFAAASGLRFNWKDAQEPSIPGSSYTSLAQERFFQRRASGSHANPEALETAWPLSSVAFGRYVGTLHADTLGRSVFVDSLHFTGIPEGLPGGVDSVRAVPYAPREFEVEGPDSAGRVRFIGQPVSADWTLAYDPRMESRSRIGGDMLWVPGAPSNTILLADLYRSTVRWMAPYKQELSLFQIDAKDILSPNTGALTNVRLVSPSATWRDGSDASGVFAIRNLPTDRTGYPPGLELVRSPLVRTLPEWTALRGSVPSGIVYQLGWSDTAGSWHPVGDSIVSNCSGTLERQGACPLGMVDLVTLPDRGRMLLRVAEGGGWRYQAIPFARGTTLPASERSVARSLFGDAQVVFPEGALSTGSEAMRTISVRVLPPSDAGLRATPGYEVVGPVVEVLPSQTFAGSALPEIVLRLPRGALWTGVAETDPSGVQLYKIDATTGTIVPLSSPARIYLKHGVACASTDAWDEIEFHGRTMSFSRFALLPKGLPDSRLWTVSVSPLADTSTKRVVTVQGVAPASLSLAWDDDPDAMDAMDRTPPVPAMVAWRGSTGVLDIPEREVSWLQVRRADGGLAKSLRVVRHAEAFAFHSGASDTLFVGRDGAVLRLPYVSNREGELRLQLLSETGNDIGWAGGTLESGVSCWRLPVPAAWSDLPARVGSRWIASERDGRSIDVPGPVLVFDRVRPSAKLSVSIRRQRDSWILDIVPDAEDDMGLVARRLVVATAAGDTLADWAALEPREFVVPDSSWGNAPDRTVDVALSVQDRAGNRTEAIWSGSLVAPELTSLLWLAPVGSARFGWGVEDRGRHALPTRTVGLTSWRDNALAFVEPTARVVTGAIGEPGVVEASIELLGIWDADAVLLGRDGIWSLSREGRDVVFRKGSEEVRWLSVFTDRSRWMHLVLTMNASGLELFRDGRPRGRRAWGSNLEWGVSRSWIAGGGNAEARLGLVRVWNEAFDSSQVVLWRRQALGIDSILWIEAERFAGGLALATPHCELPSRLAVSTGDSVRRILTSVDGPWEVRLAGRWIADAPTAVGVMIDGRAVDTVHLPSRIRWDGLADWLDDSGELRVSIPAGSHQLGLVLPKSLQLDAVALVAGEGDAARWPDSEPAIVPPQVEVLVRDESPREANYLKPRILVRNLSKTVLLGYRLHVQVRTDAWRSPVVETWWPTPLASSLAHDGHGLFTWTMDRSATALDAGQSDFGSSGAAIGFHQRDWSNWSREDDPSWDSSWASGNWVRGTGIPVFSTTGQLLSEWSCRGGGDLDYPASPSEILDTVTASSPAVLDGARARLLVPAEGSWNWGSTVVGLSPLDGQPLAGTLRWGSTSWPLAGWWQQITIPNAAHSDLTLVLDLGTSRKVQLQKWHQ